MGIMSMLGLGQLEGPIEKSKPAKDLLAEYEAKEAQRKARVEAKKQAAAQAKLAKGNNNGM